MRMGEFHGYQGLLTAIVESMSDAMYVRDVGGIVRGWNAAAEKIYGYSRDEIVGHHYSIIVPVHRRDSEAAITATLVEGHSAPAYETTGVRKGGAVIET